MTRPEDAVVTARVRAIRKLDVAEAIRISLDLALHPVLTNAAARASLPAVYTIGHALQAAAAENA